ncbi:hypothetical protein KDW_40810 [Dictyobacter vulcani]|uniref:Uncharacterized protein n=1 Tax=Dictyobacter vulcani TaxID=2607529 RepID=A0A5J4KV01_9CHLR|nr:hypothetical protein [Dictyobacter vulcani]GER89919.1 hypothetical protein KDW_40810 [Dictyobacter vulcani]
MKIIPRAPYRDPVCHEIFFNGTVSVETEATTQHYYIETFMECYLRDLERLREGLEVHIQRLTQQRLVNWEDQASIEKNIDSLWTGPSLEEMTWVPLELELRITCSEGEIMISLLQRARASHIYAHPVVCRITFPFDA